MSDSFNLGAELALREAGLVKSAAPRIPRVGSLFEGLIAGSRQAAENAAPLERTILHNAGPARAEMLAHFTPPGKFQTPTQQIGGWIDEALQGYRAPAAPVSAPVARAATPRPGSIQQESEALATKIRQMGLQKNIRPQERFHYQDLLGNADMRQGPRVQLKDTSEKLMKKGSALEKLASYMGVAQENNEMEKSASYQYGAVLALAEAGLVKHANDGMGGAMGGGMPPGAAGPHPSDQELEQILSQMSPEELQQILGHVPEENVGQALGGMDEQHLEHILSQLPPELLQAMMVGLEAQGAGAAAPEGAPAGGPPGMEGAEGPELEEEAAEAAPGAPAGLPTKGGFPPKKSKGEKKEEKGEKKDKGEKDEKKPEKKDKPEKFEKAEKTAGLEALRGLLAGAGRSAATHAGVGAGLGGVAGAMSADEGHRGSGFLRGALAGGAAGAGLGAGRTMLGNHAFQNALGNSGFMRGGQLLGKTAPGRMSNGLAALGRHAGGPAGLPVAMGGAALAGGMAGGTAQQSPMEKLRSRLGF